MTGDGRPDTLTLEAGGTRPDDLHVIFVIRAGGRELFRDEWNTSDEFREEALAPPGQRTPTDLLARKVRHDMDTFFAAENFEPATRLQFDPSWPPVSSGCDGDPRNCVAFFLRYDKEAAARARRGEDSTPPPGPAYAAFMDRIDRAPFDTDYVRMIGEEIQRRGLPAFTFSYGYETTRTITWSPRAGRFFPVFECC